MYTRAILRPVDVVEILTVSDRILSSGVQIPIFGFFGYKRKFGGLCIILWLLKIFVMRNDFRADGMSIMSQRIEYTLVRLITSPLYFSTNQHSYAVLATHLSIS